jgi:hypothetical protein
LDAERCSTKAERSTDRQAAGFSNEPDSDVGDYPNDDRSNDHGRPEQTAAQNRSASGEAKGFPPLFVQRETPHAAWLGICARRNSVPSNSDRPSQMNNSAVESLFPWALARRYGRP